MVGDTIVIPAAPGWIESNPRAHDRWLSLWPTLDRSRIDPVKHGDTVGAYCQAYADFREASEKIASLGLVVREPVGGRSDAFRVIQNPYVAVREAALRQMTELAKVLGIRPDAATWSLQTYQELAGVLREPVI
jgi:P27 family predicted phage terminase small subunit